MTREGRVYGTVVALAFALFSLFMFVAAAVLAVVVLICGGCTSAPAPHDTTPSQTTLEWLAERGIAEQREVITTNLAWRIR